MDNEVMHWALPAVSDRSGRSTFYAFDPQGNAAQRLDASGLVLSKRRADFIGRDSYLPPERGKYRRSRGWGSRSTSEQTPSYVA